MPRKPSKKTLILSGAAAIVLLGAGGAFLTVRKAPETAQQTAKPAAVEEDHAEEVPEGVILLSAEQISASGLTVVSVGGAGGGEVRLAGRVEPMVDARASVASAVSGRVERVLVAPGQTVRQGQALAILVSGDAATFRAESDAAAAQATAVRQAHDRNVGLMDQGIVALQEVEASRAQMLSAQAEARAARARARASGAPDASGRVSVVSPIGGVVSAVQVGPGGFVAQGAVVAEVGNPNRVELVFRAPAALIAEVKAGARMTVTGPQGEFAAVVTSVSADAGFGQTGASLIRARFVDGRSVPVGSAVGGQVNIGQAQTGMSVPSEAVQTFEQATVVFVQVPGGFKAVSVMVGRQSGGRTQILSGLTGAERIASANAFLLKAELAKGDAEHGH